VIRTSGRMFQDLVAGVLDQATDRATPCTGLRRAAALLVETDYADACPIAMVPSRWPATTRRCARSPRRCSAGGSRPRARFVGWGYSPDGWPAGCPVASFNTLEGAFVLARLTPAQHRAAGVARRRCQPPWRRAS